MDNNNSGRAYQLEMLDQALRQQRAPSPVHEEIQKEKPVEASSEASSEKSAPPEPPCPALRPQECTSCSNSGSAGHKG